ncbi:bola-like protein [Sporothrix brasiliensis 5110]|uniref:Bola-like protein n=1 Tax=Sporothrix brasiliensis 5110 TaxID=1398154 RepID=A0A0C2F9W1_9PEZI|nr:bola-like protein [Sporothrix brasiliensis 5110]KIH87888.1 bola-like protein [Sporothrix brasiliensis 5110]
MICSACRLARQQLVNSGRRAVSSPTSSSASTVVARRGLVTLARSAVRPSLSETHTVRRTAQPALLSTARAHSAAAATPTESSSSATASPSPIPKPDFLDDAESHIWDLLVAAFEPHELSVRDISGGCGSMYGIEICSERFRGANMLKQQRMVNGALGDLIKGWHGVQLKTRVPE